MGCYYTLCHNTYAYSILFYKVYMKRANAGSWNFGLENEQILETYSAHLQKSWNSTGIIFRIYKNIGRKKYQRGATHRPRGWRARPLPRGPPGRPPDAHLLLYGVFCPGKNQGQAYGTKLRRHKVEPWRNQYRAPAELFCQGNFPLGGGNHHHHHHQ